MISPEKLLLIYIAVMEPLLLIVAVLAAIHHIGLWRQRRKDARIAAMVREILQQNREFVDQDFTAKNAVFLEQSEKSQSGISDCSISLGKDMGSSPHVAAQQQAERPQQLRPTTMCNHHPDEPKHGLILCKVNPAFLQTLKPKI